MKGSSPPLPRRGGRGVRRIFMKTLASILTNIKAIKVLGNTSVEVSDIQFDSRKVGKGSVFIAIPGTQTDGHTFIPKVVEMGVSVVICEKLPENTEPSVVWVVVADSAEALGLLAANFYGHPSEKLKLIGVTGTNGKTTTATLLFRLFRGLGFKCGLISTVVYCIEDKTFDSTHTTPDQLALNKLLAEMVETGCEYCFMEVSSHSLAQNRTAGLKFEGGIFSNITHDHLDYHVTFDNYIKAKKLFFDNLSKEAFAVVNTDDKNGRVMVQNCAANVKSYAMRTMADFKVKVVESHFDGMQLLLDGTEFWTPLIGEFNAYNLLAVYSAAIMLGQEKSEVLRLLSSFREVAGRFETVRSKNGITAIVDYAHTPDALVNVLKTIHQIRKGDETLITVVGAGGNRDKTKRPIMARVCAENSDKVIITSDNPRHEEPEDIIIDMLAGIESQYKMKTVTIVDRLQAIKTAVMLAKPGDIILVAGKGHENYQDVKGVKHHFDDKEILKELLNMPMS
jgi:UDP-N-acetylmuramoyl-L-alanyl-D-glutamate--2,6-diaminopimelate ligase